MLALKRGAIQAQQRTCYKSVVARRAAESTKKTSKFSPQHYGAQSLAVRGYARWAKIVSKMSPEQLAKMRDNSAQKHRAPHSNVTIRTSNTVGDPWMAPRMSNPFAGKLWRDLFEWGKHAFMTYIGSAWRIRNTSNQLKVPKVTRSEIKKAAVDTYIKYNQILSKFQISSLTSMVSDSEMTKLKTKFGKTVLPNGTNPVWEHQNLRVGLLNWAVLQAPAPLNLHFIQATVRITGNQKFAVFDHNGKVVLGEDSFKPVEDTWVLEKILERPESPWVVISTHLDHPDDVAAAKTSQPQ